ncbi:RING-type domain-containing protein, partial [Haematococcus lacustris]
MLGVAAWNQGQAPAGPGPQVLGGYRQHAAGELHGGIRAEQVIDKLTERITDRLRLELKVELQKESASMQVAANAAAVAMDGFLAAEIETQNACPICYELMVPPDKAPQLLFPCGHTFCTACVTSHIEKHHKCHCPVCRKKIESRAPNYSLQQLILNFVNRRDKVLAAKGEGGAGGQGGLRAAVHQ